MKTHRFQCYALIYSTIILGFTLISNAQTQKGSDIDGEAAYDWSGFSVNMPDVNTIAIGAYGNDDAGSIAGHVRIYTWDGSSWLQKGNDIDGEAAQDQSGYVSMPDANTVAIGTPFNDGNGDRAGHVRVFEWSGTAWVQKGIDIDGESTLDYTGQSVSMPDPDTVAVGDYSNSAIGTYAGRVRIFSWNGGAWVQKGSGINGEADFDHAGTSVSMPDANTIAIGAKYNAANGANAGHVRIYTWSGSSWDQKGSDIDGVAGSYSGSSVSMPDINTVAIGAPYYSTSTGQVRVFTWNGSFWAQKGSNINGVLNSYSGNSVSMPDSNTLAVGANFGDINGQDSGDVRVYSWSGSAWVLKSTISGQSANDQSGSSVSMPDANTVATGAPFNGILDSGRVRIFTGVTLGVDQKDIETTLTGYPNPTDGHFTIKLNGAYNAVAITVRNILGLQVQKLEFNTMNSLEFDITGSAGLYFLEIDTDQKKSVLKVIKN